MSIAVLICDDSRIARTQLSRSLPENWDIQCLFAENGKNCLSVAAEFSPDLIFLDLNMPEMDGYEFLQFIKSQNLAYKVIVVSGDIQPEAKSRVMNNGAIDFVKKPITKDNMIKLLIDHGFYKDDHQDSKKRLETNHIDMQDMATFMDACQEVANVAMGRSADKLARFLDVFVELPIPKVNYIEISELAMALEFAQQNDKVSSVCQGFIGPDLSGEALLIFNDTSSKNIAKLMKHQGEINPQVELELLMDMANILVGSCLQGISDQLDIKLSQGHPVVLGQGVMISDLIKGKPWSKTLSIEITYAVENIGVSCDLLLLFTEGCLDNLKQRMSYLV